MKYSKIVNICLFVAALATGVFAIVVDQCLPFVLYGVSGFLVCCCALLCGNVRITRILLFILCVLCTYYLLSIGVHIKYDSPKIEHFYALVLMCNCYFITHLFVANNLLSLRVFIKIVSPLFICMWIVFIILLKSSDGIFSLANVIIILSLEIINEIVLLLRTYYNY